MIFSLWDSANPIAHVFTATEHFLALLANTGQYAPTLMDVWVISWLFGNELHINSMRKCLQTN